MKAGIGIGPGSARVGEVLRTQTSSEFNVGEEMRTWSGLHVRITDKKRLTVFGSWRYEYAFEVINAR